MNKDNSYVFDFDSNGLVKISRQPSGECVSLEQYKKETFPLYLMDAKAYLGMLESSVQNISYALGDEEFADTEMHMTAIRAYLDKLEHNHDRK